MFELFKSIFGGKKEEKSEVEKKIDFFKNYVSKRGYTWKGHYAQQNKISFYNDKILIVVEYVIGNVVTTDIKKGIKAKRYNLTDDEILMVIDNPKVRIEDKRFQIIDK